jgi:PhzF family phenazine biosynthesis protein
VFIAAPAPRFLPLEIDADDIARALRIDLGELDGKYPVSLVNAGLNSLLLPMRRASRLTDVLPVFEELCDFCVEHGVDIVVPFTDDRILPGSNYRTRVFAPRFGYLEDPATGSGNAALGAMLLREGFWKGGELTIEQGTSYHDPNIVRLRPSGNGDGVLFGGGATVRIDGAYCLN